MDDHDHLVSRLTTRARLGHHGGGRGVAGLHSDDAARGFTVDSDGYVYFATKLRQLYSCSARHRFDTESSRDELLLRGWLELF